MAQSKTGKPANYFQPGAKVTEGNLGWFNIEIDSLLDGYELKRGDGALDDNLVNLNGEYDHRSIDQLRVRYSIVSDKTAATRDLDFTSPKATLSTTSFKKEDIIVIKPSEGYARLYIPTLQDEIYEDPEKITIRLKPDDIIVERTCTNCHLVVDLWKYLPENIRGLTASHRSQLEEGISNKKRVKGFQQITQELGQIIGKIRNGKINDEFLELQWKGILTVPESGTYKISMLEGVEFANGLNLDFDYVVDCVRYSKWDTEQLNLSINQQVPIQYNAVLLPSQIQSLKDEEYKRLKEYIKNAAVKWQNGSSEIKDIDNQLVTTRNYSGIDIVKSYDQQKLNDAEQYIYDLDGNIDFESKKPFEINIEPERKFRFYSVAANKHPHKTQLRFESALRL